MASITEKARKEALSRQLAESREALGQRLGQRVARVQRILDVPTRTKAAMTKNPAAAVGGAVLIGLVASVWMRRRRKRRTLLAGLLAEGVGPRRKASLMAGVFSMVGGMARTAAKAYLMESLIKRISPSVSPDKLRPR